MSASEQASKRISPNFITEIIESDVQQGRVPRLGTRWPPEPNGYPHLGHAFACLLNHGLAQDFGGRFVLRMDDTNPEAERQEYVDAMLRDVAWIGADWAGNLSYASDYFPQLHAYAVKLIEAGHAYVESLPHEEMVRLRGSVDQPGTPSPYRDRSVAENLELFERMRAGEFPKGSQVLRAKIDLGSPNMKLRDPVLYRIVHATHYRTGNTWCIYPSYDFAQAITDALDGVTHSLCSLEFVDNNAVYKWLMEHLWANDPSKPQPPPRQFEFGRRSLEYTVVSKRKLRKLVDGGFVAGWDDPRMPTISALRRRGITPEAVRDFTGRISVSRTNRTVDIALLENAVRNDLNARSPRVMAVLRPLRVILEGATDTSISLPYWPHDVVKDSPDGLVGLPDGSRVRPEAATREVPFTAELFIEREDFAVTPPPGFKRLTVNGRVRLRGAGVIECTGFDTDDAGNITTVRCTVCDDTAKASGVIHWVSASRGVPFEARLYDRLFRVPHPEAEAKELEPGDPETGDDEHAPEADFLSFLNPASLEVLHGFVEPSVRSDPTETRYQFERLGYFWRDPEDSSPERLVFNRIVTLRDSWAKESEAPRTSERHDTKKTGPVQQRELELSPEQQAALEALVKEGVSESEARVLAREDALAAYLRDAAQHGEIASLSSWVVNDLGPRLREGPIKLEPAGLAALVALVQSGEITRATAKDVLAEALETGASPSDIVAAKGLRQVSDAGALEAIMDRLMLENSDKVDAYRAGRTGLAGFFVGQVRQATNGTANPQVVQDVVSRKLKG